MIYANFFSPSVVATLFCLHQCTVEGEEKNPRSSTVQFLISKILAVTDASSVCLTSQQFERELERATGDREALEKYRESILRVNSFNDFYRDLSKMLKTLRSLRNNKLEQGNLIDFLVRRLYIYFEKLDFKEIIGIYQQFDRFRSNRDVNQPQHEFMLTRSIEEVKFNLENYGGKINPEQVSKRVQQLREYDHTNKSSYLWSLVQAGEMNPIGAVNAMHRYFDKSLGNLFQEKTEISLMSNKINHCILSGAFLQLKMNFLQECLQAVSEGLRISQNNSDEESINNCIIYLYRVSEQLGRHQQQILLNEHAITHSLNLSNALLMVYSCLSYSLAQRLYDTTDPSILLLKHRNISWTDALHFSRKKVFSTFQSNCKNIYHTHRSLLLPAFMCKLAVLAHLPCLRSLLLNPYYQRPQLFDLEVYQQFQQQTPEHELLAQTLRYFRCHQSRLLQQNIRLLRQAQKQAKSPLEIIRIRIVLARVRLQWSSFQSSHGEAERLVEFCERYGFVKEEMMEAWLLVIQILLSEGMYQDSLVKVELLLKHASSQKLQAFEVGATLLGIQGRLQLGADLMEAADTLQRIELESDLLSLKIELREVFLQTKIMLVQQLYRQLSSSIECYEATQQLRTSQLELLQSLLGTCLDGGNLAKSKHVLLSMYDLLLASPAAVPIIKHDRIKRTLTYCQKALTVYQDIDENGYEEQALLGRVISKIRSLYFC